MISGLSLSSGDLGASHGTALQTWRLNKCSQALSFLPYTNPVWPWQLSCDSLVILFVAGRNRNRNGSWVSSTHHCLVSAVLARADLFHIGSWREGELVLMPHPALLAAPQLLRSRKKDEPGAASWEAKSDSCVHSSFGVLCADDLAANANVLIDPAELQAVTMDDLDEDEESATSAAQVSHGL